MPRAGECPLRRSHVLPAPCSHARAACARTNASLAVCFIWDECVTRHAAHLHLVVISLADLFSTLSIRMIIIIKSMVNAPADNPRLASILRPGQKHTMKSVNAAPRPGTQYATLARRARCARAMNRTKCPGRQCTIRVSNGLIFGPGSASALTAGRGGRLTTAPRWRCWRRRA